MKPNFLNRRELLILGLPLLLIGIGGIIFTIQEKKRIERESGPLRLVVVRAEPVTVSSREAWQGYDLKYRFDYELRGIVPSKTKWGYSEIWSNKNECLTVVDNQGKTQRFSGLRFTEYEFTQPYVPTPIKFIDSRNDTDSNLYSTLLIDRDAFPSGKATIKLSSKFFGWRKGNKDVVSFPANWSQVIDNDITPLNINRASPKYISSELTVGPPIVSEHRVAAYKAGFNYDQGTSKLLLFWNTNGLIKNREFNRLTFLNSRFEDEKGQEVQLLSEQKKNGQFHFYSLQSTLNRAYSTKGTQLSGQYYTNVAINIYDVPKSYGAIFLKSNFSINDSWPVPFRAEVRPKWVCKLTSKLKIENVEVTGKHVAITVRYLGNKPIEYKSPTFPYFSTMNGSNGMTDPVLNPETDRLICNWSQHLEQGGNKLFYKSPSRRGNEPTQICQVQEIFDLGNSFYRIYYLVDYPKSSQMKFKAEIGIGGDGFVPIEVRMP